MYLTKGALAAPLFFVGLALAAAGSVEASALLWAGSILTILLATLTSQRAQIGVTPIALAVFVYVGWTMLHGFVSRPYTPAGVFHPAFLLAGFAVSRRWDAQTRQASLRAFSAGAAGLACWALYEAANGQGRGHAFLETPNTLATLLNLALAPLLVRIAYGERRALLLLLAVALSAGLVATLSRGGFIALAAALAVVWFLAPRRPSVQGLSRLTGGMVVGALVGFFALEAPQWLATQAGAAPSGIDEVISTFGASAASRSELYSLAASSVAAHPWLGSGYLGFRALLEARRAQVPSYGTENITYFAHNDYLQTLLELGIPGAAALVAMVLVPFWIAIRVRSSAPEDVTRLAALAGIAAMSIHALVDFPFYVPICLLLFGALLGEVDQRSPHRRSVVTITAFGGSRLVKVLAAAAAVVLLGAPAMAEGLAKYGDHSWRSGKAQAAAVAFEWARQMQPRDWRYHWYAGQFWHAQALGYGNREAAERADRAFAAAMAANPAEPRALLSRLATQLRLGPLLKNPQPLATLRLWADDALALAPLNPTVRQDSAAAITELTRRQ